MSDGVSVDFLLKAEKRIRALLRELRPVLLEVQGQIEHALKDDQSVVTKMDIMVEERLRQLCAEIDPGIGFCGEETGVNYKQRTFWLVDPIDGTEAFIRGLPFWTCMVALVHDGQIIMGIIYNFTLDDYYLAIQGRGARCNGHPIKVSERSLKRSFITLNGMNHLPVFAYDFRKMVAGLPKAHASGYEMSQIARGALDGSINQGTKGAWDFAAGSILIQEAGGRVENMDSPSYDFKNLQFVTGNRVIFDQLKTIALDAVSNPRYQLPN